MRKFDFQSQFVTSKIIQTFLIFFFIIGMAELLGQINSTSVRPRNDVTAELPGNPAETLYRGFPAKCAE